ncbi:unnamed protein product [Ilex paraguariensis]|uniref:FAD-binding PCMH-type domain-containing protein n=1 Tax=Ilex paraguariensis TaxID=185542 RepID=A0ABC8V2U6_9AQUA
MKSVTVNVEDNTAWVQAGATLGEVYYSIANMSRTLAFPAGLCPTVGFGGHLSGGGYGVLLRKFGLAADNILDAHLVDVNGKILDKNSMGEDLFWAIRGGGGASFGVILAWKINLVVVPETLTIFSVSRTLEQNATKLIHRWQYIAPKLDEDLYIGVLLRNANPDQDGKRTIQASFDCFFLGGVDKLLPLMQKEFPELGLVKEDCREVSWIESELSFYGGQSLDILLNRTYLYKAKYKIKSDFVKQPISESTLEGIWERFLKEDVNVPSMLLNPYGGKMSEISEYDIPFPHRVGIIFSIEYQVGWQEEGTVAAKRHINWIRELYQYMTPYVSKNPREAYLNYRDLDIGVNNEGNTSYANASIWGTKYFKNNFNRLVYVKTLVDPGNFFKNEQSIPPVS